MKPVTPETLTDEMVRDVGSLVSAIDDCPQVLLPVEAKDWWSWLRRVQQINDRLRRAINARSKETGNAE